MRQTFADILINHGIEFPSDTVIIAVDLPMGGEISIADSRIKPVFDNMFIECYMTNSSTGFIVKSVEEDVFGIMAYSPGKGHPYQLPFVAYTYVTPDGYHEDTKLQLLDDTARMAEGHINTIINLCYAVLSLFHKDHEIELITHSRQVKRQIKRKTGKEPSPYFQINVNVDKKNKRYTASKPTGNTKNAHIVRGHFATYTDDNPLFGKYTGTYWRPSHARGIKSGENPTPKNYRIVLPDPTE